MVFKLGITGGIASGKSKCLAYLSQHPQISTLNLDSVAFQVYDNNPSVIKALQSRFGEDVWQNNKLNRPFLAQQAFKDEPSTKALNDIVGPEIRQLMHKHFEQAHRDNYKICAVEGAILIESGTYKVFDEMWCVTLPKELAIERVKTRNPLMTEEDIMNRLRR